MPAVAFSSLEWKSTLMPGSKQPVQLARLPAASDGAFRAFVRFPAGWRRAEAGYYAAAEEFLVLEGELELNGVTWAESRYAWIAPYQPRRDLGSRPGCLVLAWFSASPRWIPGDPPFADLTVGAPHRTQFLERGPASAGLGCEALGLRSRHWQADETSPFRGEEEIFVRRWQPQCAIRCRLQLSIHH